MTRTPDPDLSGTGGQGNDDEADVLSLGEVEVFGRELLSYDQIFATDLQDVLYDQSASVYLAGALLADRATRPTWTNCCSGCNTTTDSSPT